MATKKFWVGMPVMVLVFGVAVIGCDTGNGTSLGFTHVNVDGTWNGIGDATGVTITISGNNWTIAGGGFNDFGTFNRDGDTANLFSGGTMIGTVVITGENSFRISIPEGTFNFTRRQASGDNNNNDTWSNITNLTPLAGAWLRTYTQTRTLEQFNADNNFEPWDASRAEYYGPVMVESFVTYTLGVTVQTQTTGSFTIMSNHIAMFSGGNIETVWTTIRTVYAGIGIINDSARSITYIYTSMSSQPISTDVLNIMGVQISHSGTRIRLPANSWGAGEPPSEIIFSRQVAQVL